MGILWSRSVDPSHARQRKMLGVAALLAASSTLGCATLGNAFSYPAHHCQYGDILDCEHYPPTPQLREPSSDGYRFANAPASDQNSDELFVVLILSGGGTRSAALSYGVMKELGRAMVPRANRSLLDEVDVISSVSGGSFPAAYLALNGPAGLPNFEGEFLRWNAQKDLIFSVLFNQGTRNRLRSQYFGRSDLAVEKWDQHVFHGATFGQLIGRRPFLMIDATDIATGTVFPFTQQNVDPLCVDLAKFQIARAVGASGAFPPLLNPITIENHASHCRYLPPEWVTKSSREQRVNPEVFRLASEVMSYTNVGTRPYIHLTDGGIGDNIGARNVMRALSMREAEIPLVDMVEAGLIQRMLIIVVNAKTVDENDIDKSPHSPGFVRTALGAAGAPMNNYSRQSIAELWHSVEQLEEKHPDTMCSNASLVGCLSMFYTVELSFDQISDIEERRFFEHLPTSYALDNHVVDALIARGGQLLRMNPEYNRLLCDLQHGDWKKRGADAACRERAYLGYQASQP